MTKDTKAPEEKKEEKTDRILYPNNKKHLFDDVIEGPMHVNIDVPSQTVRNVFSIMELDERTIELYNRINAVEHQMKHIQEYIVRSEEERRMGLIEKLGMFFGKMYGKVTKEKQP